MAWFDDLASKRARVVLSASVRRSTQRSKRTPQRRRLSVPLSKTRRRRDYTPQYVQVNTGAFFGILRRLFESGTSSAIPATSPRVRAAAASKLGYSLDDGKWMSCSRPKRRKRLELSRLHTCPRQDLNQSENPVVSRKTQFLVAVSSVLVVGGSEIW